MRRSFALTAATVFVLGACGSDPTESESIVPDETSAPTPTTEPPPTVPAATAPDPTARADAADGEPSTTGTSGAEPSEPVETVPLASDAVDPDTTEPPSTPDRLGLIAATDLADRLDIDVGDIEVLEVEEVTWSDASLGCPQKDFQYPQVLTPGLRIALSAQGATYAYHAGPGRDPFYCIDPQTPV